MSSKRRRRTTHAFVLWSIRNTPAAIARYPIFQKKSDRFTVSLFDDSIRHYFAELFRSRKNCLRSFVTLRPIQIAHIRASDHILHNLPLTSGLTQKGKYVVVECSRLLGTDVNRPRIIGSVTCRRLWRAAEECPVPRNAKVIGCKYDLLFQFPFHRSTKSIHDGFPFGDPRSGVYTD